MLHIVTDRGICSWPWQCFALGTAHRPSFATSIWFTPVTNKLGWSAVLIYVYDITLLFSVVFYMVTAVHKFDFRPVTSETPNKWRPVIRKSCCDRNSCFSGPLPFLPTVVARIKGLPTLCRSNALFWVWDISLVRETYCLQLQGRGVGHYFPQVVLTSVFRRVGWNTGPTLLGSRF